MTLDPSDRRLRKLETFTFLSFVIVTTVAFLWVIHPFFAPLFWAAVLALLFQWLYTRLLRAFGGRPSAAALVATLATIVFVVLPFAAVLAALTRQGLLLYQGLASGEISLQPAIDLIERTVPAASGLLERYGIDVEHLRVSLQQMAAGATQAVAGWALTAGRNVLGLALSFGLMLYLMFFFFRDGEDIVERVMRAVPLGADRKQRLLRKFAEVARATVKGTLIIALAQGGLGAVLFAVVGVRTAVFWGAVMAVLSLLPAVGAGLVWLPAAVIFFAGGHVWQGVLVVLGGVFVIGLVDNLLRPIVVGRDTQTPDYLVLLSTLGGLAAFGVAGFVAGPVIAALFLVLWEIFAEEYAKKTLLD